MSQSLHAGSPDQDYAVRIEGVAKSYAALVAVKHIDLAIRRGEFITLLGPSGCGKTTLLNMIAGFEEPTAGHISIDGRDVTHVPPHQRDTGMVFQNYALFPHMSVFDNVAFGLRMRKRPEAQIKQEVERALETVKLAGVGSRRVRQLSGGQQQRIALARAMVFGPRVLLLDEPLSALDKNLRTEMQFELKELHAKTGLTTVFVTHDQGEALSMSDRIVVMSRGEIQQISEPLELYNRPANAFVASFIGEINALPATMRRTGDHAAFEFAGGAKLVSSAPAALRVADGEKVRVFVRPEHIRLLEPGATAPDMLQARIVSRIFQGSHTIARLACDGIGQLEMRVPGGKAIGRHADGDEVSIALDLDEAVILPDRD